jgi:hypothetical protein
MSAGNTPRASRTTTSRHATALAIANRPWRGADRFESGSWPQANGFSIRRSWVGAPTSNRAKNSIYPEHIAETVVSFVLSHEGWATPIVFVLAFLELIAFWSLLMPPRAIGALIGASGIPV